MNIIGICFKTNFSQLFSSFSTSRSMSTYPSTFSLRKRTTVSTWLDCSRWMSKPRKISPFVLGNKSTAFLTSKLPFSRPRTFSKTGRCACPYYIYICSRTYFPIVSTHRSEGICPKSCDFPSTRLYICIMYRYESLSGYSYGKGSSYFVIRR